MLPVEYAPSPPVVPWAEGLIIAAGFVWGTVLGSFLNVVAHRVPRRESVVSGGSRCPWCGAAIRACDNVPILGWLLLGGRCRDCRAPIPARYPLVEAAGGVLVAAVVAADLVAGGIDRVLLHGDWLPLVCCACHAGVLLTVLAWALLAAAGGHLPPHVAASTVAATGLLALAVPAVQPLGVLAGGAAWPPGSPRLAAAVAWAGGATAGWVCGTRIDRRTRASLILFGAAFGWQTVTAVAVVTAVILSLRRPRDGGFHGGRANTRNRPSARV